MGQSSSAEPRPRGRPRVSSRATDNVGDFLKDGPDDAEELERLIELSGLRHCEERMDAIFHEMRTWADQRHLVQDTMLTKACSKNKLECVKHLVSECKADVDARDKHGMTPLMNALVRGNMEMIEYLCNECNANPHIACEQGKTASEHAGTYGLPEEALQFLGQYMESFSPAFVQFEERKEFSELMDDLTHLQPQSDEWYVSMDLRMEWCHNKPKVEAIFAQLRVLYDQDKDRLRLNPKYYKSMVMLKEAREFASFLGANKIYQGVWQTLTAREAEWDENVDRLAQWAREYKHYHSQSVRKISQIYPLCIVAQNRVNDFVARLAEATNASMGKYTEAGVKSLSRGFQKAAFNTKEPYSADSWDWARGLISYPTLGGILNALETLRDGRDGDFSDVRMAHVSNGFKNYSQKPETWKSPWQSLKVYFVFTDDFLDLKHELQLCHKQFTVARRDLGGHNEYSKFRSVNEMELFIENAKKK